MRHGIRASLTALLLAWSVAEPASAQGRRGGAEEPTNSADTTAQAATLPGAPVVLRGDTVLVVLKGSGTLSAAERAAIIQDRLGRVSGTALADRDSLKQVTRENGTAILAGSVTLATVSDADADAEGATRAVLAAQWQEALGRALAATRRGTLHTVLLASLFTLLTTIALLLLLRLLQRVFPRLHTRLDAWEGTRIRAIRLQRLELVSGERIAAALHAFLRLLRAAVTVLLAYAYLLLVFSFFPWTRHTASALAGYVVEPLAAMFYSFANYLPELLHVALIVVVTYYMLKVVRMVFDGMAHGAITLPGFYPDWALPTYKIIRFLGIVLAVIMIWPHLPNSDSIAFKGVAAFLGLLFSLGSASAVSNVIGGTVMVYMRPFQVGDRVRIADTVGDVVEKNLLVTRVRTIKNVDVTIPNAMVLGSHIINYSSTAVQRGLILHTSVTIGYDTPWRSVHEALIAAARSTDGVLPDPAPFVLQTALNDFYVSYEINAYTDQPGRMALTYSALHQSIQDRFSEAGIEITSPHYAALRDGNAPVMPRAPDDGETAERRFRVSLDRENVRPGAVQSDGVRSQSASMDGVGSEGIGVDGVGSKGVSAEPAGGGGGSTGP